MSDLSALPPLPDRHLRFVTEYLKDLNAGAAAARAGYSEKSSASTAVALMKNEAIRDRIRIELESLLAEARCTSLALIKERMAAAFFRADKMFGEGFEPLAPGEMEEATRNAVEVSTVLRKSGPVVRIKQPDRDRALRALERVHERLDRLNEQHYAKLKKEGRVPTLEEIERMDQAPAPAENAQNPSDLLGCGDSAPRAFSEKPLDLLGSADEGAAAPLVFGANPLDLLGSGRTDGPQEGRGRLKTFTLNCFSPPRPQASPWLLRPPEPAAVAV